jgi:1,4-dihydroxy-2-naphthoate octaprenyltransferase
MKEFRAPFLVAVIIPTFLGGAIAATTPDTNFHVLNFILTLIGIVFIHIGANVTNDYFDYKAGPDRFITPEEKTPFSGGSGLLADGTLRPKTVLNVGILFLVLGSLIGLYFVYFLGSNGWVILVIGLVGVSSGFFYTAPPFRFVYRGVGEFFIWLSFGPLVVFGAFFVQTAVFSWEPVIASIPVGLLIATILFINEFPDYRPDKKGGKKQLVVRLGKERAVKGYLILLVSVYISIVVSVIIGLMDLIESIPVWSLITLLTIPISVKAYLVTKKHFGEPQKMIPANAATVMIFSLTAILFCLAYLPELLGLNL